MYKLTLSDKEVETLGWLVNRGYFPEELYDAMYLEDEERNEAGECVWMIPEHAAWSLLELRENDPGAYLSCLGGELLHKVIRLEEQIV